MRRDGTEAMALLGYAKVRLHRTHDKVHYYHRISIGVGRAVFKTLCGRDVKCGFGKAIPTLVKVVNCETCYDEGRRLLRYG